MACNFLTRLFHRRRQAAASDAFAAPGLPASDEKCVRSLEHLTIHEATSPDFFYLGYLAEQGSYTLRIRCIPSQLDTTSLDQQVGSIQGFVSAQYVQEGNRTDTLDLHINFSTAVDAAMALANQPTVNLGNGQRRHLQFADFDTDITTTEPARKRVKVKDTPRRLPNCRICSEQVSEPYSKPCYYCKTVWCYDCLQNQFKSALDDHEMFPAKCCGKVYHFDVARAAIPADDLQKYRRRFEEHNISKPIYCGNAKCSAFLPPRLSKPNAAGAVHCSECQSSTCVECRMLMSEDASTQSSHKCTGIDEVTALLKQYDYKRCPRCNGGVAKMYGCPHVRCQCGAHWCWDCQRPIQVCWSRPCERAREDGLETDESDTAEEGGESEEDSTPEATHGDNNAIRGDGDTQVQTVITETAPGIPAQGTETVLTPMQRLEAILAETASNRLAAGAEAPDQDNTAVPPTAAPIPAPGVPAEEFINLDGQDADDWEQGSFDFGEEPIDESWDTWGCMHRFGPVINTTVWFNHRQWLPEVMGKDQSMVKEIDCMKCYKTVVLSPPDMKTRTDDADGKLSRTDSACDVTTSNEMAQQPADGATSASNTVEEATKKKKKRKDRKLSEAPALYNCGKCGVFYCVGCRGAVEKELRILRDRRTQS